MSVIHVPGIEAGIVQFSSPDDAVQKLQFEEEVGMDFGQELA